MRNFSTLILTCALAASAAAAGLRNLGAATNSTGNPSSGDLSSPSQELNSPDSNEILTQIREKAEEFEKLQTPEQQAKDKEIVDLVKQQSADNKSSVDIGKEVDKVEASLTPEQKAKNEEVEKLIQQAIELYKKEASALQPQPPN
ncbi:hypothetical protein HIM_07886 [Hirsutella minnesotensis 3608]|uniref:Uncharacterized protein n=1 Tax=Hirsutella minnesotensis 3608 TaxID=1043627 RepID=A0A0F8A3Z6_9HYPO|nr:hypothetical protein HIM_07886 [Hirsutella minnesotensis 3608]